MIRPPLLQRRPVRLVLLACLLLALAAFVIGRPAGRSQPVAARPAAVLEFLPSDIVQVGRGELRRQLPVSGSLRALQQASVKARVPGEVREVLVREGESVEAGQVLVRMDGADYQARLEQARGSLSAARGQLDIAQKARDNNRALLDQGFISKNAVDTTESQYRIAQANVDTARGAFDVARKAVGDTVIRSPIAGVVSSRAVQPGEKVSADSRLLDVVDLDPLEMEAAVPASDILQVAAGQEVRLRVEGLEQPLAGKVTRINPATTAGSRSIMIYVQVDNPQRMLRVGMFAEARLTLECREGVLLAPATAVLKEAGADHVYAIENGKLARKPVTLGMQGSDGRRDVVEILSGLQPGDTVVRTNLGTLRPGADVRVLAPAPAQ